METPSVTSVVYTYDQFVSLLKRHAHNRMTFKGNPVVSFFDSNGEYRLRYTLSHSKGTYSEVMIKPGDTLLEITGPRLPLYIIQKTGNLTEEQVEHEELPELFPVCHPDNTEMFLNHPHSKCVLWYFGKGYETGYLRFGQDLNFLAMAHPPSEPRYDVRWTIHPDVKLDSIGVSLGGDFFTTEVSSQPGGDFHLGLSGEMSLGNYRVSMVAEWPAYESKDKSSVMRGKSVQISFEVIVGVSLNNETGSISSIAMPGVIRRIIVDGVSIPMVSPEYGEFFRLLEKSQIGFTLKARAH